MACADKNPHAMVVPATSQSHINACMLLARSLAAVGFKVSFVYFSSEYAKFKAKKGLVEPDSAHKIWGGDTSLYQCNTTTHSSSGSGDGSSRRGSPCEGNTPANPATSCTDAGANYAASSHRRTSGELHIHVVEDEFAAGDIDKVSFYTTPAMKENMLNLILELREQGTPLTCLITDPFAPWTIHVAECAGIPLITYWTSNAMSFLLLNDISLLFSQGIFPEKGSPTQWKRETPLMLDHIPGLPPFSSELYAKEVRFGDASSRTIAILNEVFSCGKHGERMLIHTMSELEPDTFHALQAVGIPAYAIGPLLHHTKKQEGSSASSQAKENLGQLGVLQPKEEIDCISWLNTQRESSVIYIAFGSLAIISVEDIQELAFGLEASGNRFLWVIREDLRGGAGLPQVLPHGFLDRIRGKAMIISWAPQMEILAHKAIGGFLTHCGWNSTLESLWEGVPMLCCPCFAEQNINSHYLCYAWGVGLELTRTETGGIERRYVEIGVKGLMQEEEGLKARGKAQEVMQLARKTCQQGGQSFSNLQKFYEDMKGLYSKPS